MTKTVAVITTFALALGSVAACNSANDQDIDTGVVTKKTSKRVTVLEDDGEYDTHRYRGWKCQIGTRWPDCKK